MTLRGFHGSGTILGSITLTILAFGQALAGVTRPQPRPEVDRADHRNPSEDARIQNIWLFGG
jgi:hypothetical protein